MAIDKNFVIKNGLEVNTNVLVAAADEKQVGIGTTRPYYKLHVGGGEGSRGGIGATDLTISGIATIGVAHSDSGAFKVLGISTFQGDVDLLGSAGVSTVRWDASKDGLIFQDNATARFGTGEDLRIWHDGSNSYISDQGTGSLIIYGTDETLAVFTDDGSVQLYNNDSKKLETTGLGITVYGDSIVSGVTTTARLNVTGVSTFTSVGSNIIPDVDGSRNIGAATSEWGDLFVDGTAHIDTLDVDETAYVTTSLTVGTGVTVQSHGGVSIAGITTVGGALDVNSTSDFANNVNISAGSLNISAGGITLGSGATITNAGNAAFAGIVTANGGVNVGTAVTIDAETGNVAISGITTIGGNLYVTGDITYDEVTGRNLNITGITTLADQVNFGTSGIGATIYSNGNMTVSGITTMATAVVSSGDLSVGFSTFFVDNSTGYVGVGTAAPVRKLEVFSATSSLNLITLRTAEGAYGQAGLSFASNSSVGREKAAIFFQETKGSAHHTGDLVFSVDNAGGDAGTAGLDEERLRITKDGHVGIGTSMPTDRAAFSNTRILNVGIVTANRFIGIHTSADGGGIGIGSTTAHVGYGITYIDFKGPGVSTVYSSSVTGITTIYFQGGGSSVGAAGTWQNDGTQGISTAKSVGINTVGVAVTALMGGEKGASSGIGASMQGLYIGNGMMINDNQLNGNHYIGTAFGGIMAGPVTVNGVVTVDGNWAVV